jgi:hypothetical protein
MHRLFIILSVVLLCSSLAYSQNLLLNPSFTDPPVTTPCAEDWQDVADWQMTPQGPTSSDRRNGDFKGPACPGNGDDTHISLQGWGSQTSMAWQTVTGLTTGSYYKLSGLWYYGADYLILGTGLTVSAELRTGSDPDGGVVIGSTQTTISNATTTIWLPFRACGLLSAGTEITVVVKATYSGLVGWALHVDDMAMEQVASCVEPNRVDSISPGYDVRGNTVSATITGFDFTRGPISAMLTKPGASDIVATDLSVISPTVMTCKFNLTNAPNGRWSVVVNFGSGDPLSLTLPSGFNVVLPGLSNGSFESPTEAGGCPVTPLSGHPTDWLASHTGSWGDTGYDATTVVRDRTDIVPPSCPPPDGQHYASTYSVPPNPNAQPESWGYQTIKVDSTKTYTISGYFAGAGDNTVTLELLDGDEQAAYVPNAPSGLIHDNGPASDWTFAYVQGKPSGDLMTVRWRVSTRNAGPHVAHADGLRMDVCTASVTATSVSPPNGDNTGPLAGVEIIGSGFSGGTAPKVMLAGTGLVSVNATNVVVHSDTRLTCDLNLTDQPTGLRDIVVFKEGCAARLAGAFVVLSPSLANGGFESPDPGVPVDCASPNGILKGVPKVWSAILTAPGRLDRDHHVQRPATCPSTAGGHYGSLTIDRPGDMVAYQTLRVTPTAGYTFSGLFAGGGANNAVIQLIDGLPNSGQVLAETSINDDAGGAAYDWRTRQVSAYAKSGIMTVVWRTTTTADEVHALHADGLTFAMTSDPCNDPFADADDDGDVDQADFAVWQTCFSPAGPVPVDPEYCRCFNRDAGSGDSDIDLADYQAFEQCASGPGIAANAACDN